MVMLIDRRPPVELPQKYCPEKIHKVLLEAAAVRVISLCCCSFPFADGGL
jgi:hypothetical protein